MIVEVEVHITMDTDLEAISGVCRCAVFKQQIIRKPLPIVTNYSQLIFVAVNVTMGFLRPFLVKRRLNDEK